MKLCLISEACPYLTSPPLVELFPHNNSGLELESTLLELSLDNLEIESEQLGEELAHAFANNPLIPGVIVNENGKFLGMISRQRFLESMSRPYGIQLFSHRPIKDLYRFVKSDMLIIPARTSIITAARQSLQRNAELFYEPIIVEIEPGMYRLLDVQKLLIASAQIHDLAKILLQKANQELQYIAASDGLTNLANRRRFDEYLDQEWRRLAREKGVLSLILIDIDYFKKYNDTYGHLAGDDCLYKVANAIREAVKRPADLVARYGGEEFAVILPNTDICGAVHVAEMIRQNVKSLQITHTNSAVSHLVSISIGISNILPSHELVSERLIKQADEALYQAKREGRDRVVVKSCACYHVC